MPIRRCLADEVFEPDIIAAMGQAFDAATKDLKANAVTRKVLIASRIIAAARGERDIEKLRDAALNKL